VVTAAGAVSAAPDGLPAPDWHFTGRAAQLRALTQALDGAGQPRSVVICSVTGPGGTGKTALAVQWAHQVAPRFPDGQLHANLGGSGSGSDSGPGPGPGPGSGRDGRPPATTGEVIRGFLDALDVPVESVPASPQDQIGLYRSLLAGKRVLVLLDDASDAAAVQPLLPAGGGCLVLVTSRSPLDHLAGDHDPAPVALGELAEDEALELVAKLLGPRAAASGQDVAASLVSHCGRLPLALVIACARLAARGDKDAGELIAGLAAEAAGAAVLHPAGDPAGATRLGRVIAWSYQQLDEPTARLFRLLSVHQGTDVTAQAAASLADVDVDAAARALAELAALRLLDLDQRGRYSMPELVGAFARQLAAAADPPGVLQAAARRLLDHYLHTAALADRLLFPRHDPLEIGDATAGVRPEPLATPDEAMGWFIAERRVLLDVIDQAGRDGFDVHAWQLTSCVAMFLDSRRHWQDFSSVQAAAITAAGRLGDLDGLARSHHAYARACIRLGRDADAMTEFERALGLYRASGDRNGQGSVHLGMSQLLCLQGDYAAAVPHARQAMELATAGDRNGHAQALNQLGWTLAHLGAIEPAIEYCHQALGMYGPGESRAGEPETWDSLGYAYHRLGDHRLAISCYQQAMTLWRAVGDRYDQAMTLIRLGEVHDSAGEVADAEEAWTQALALLHELKHPQAADVQIRLRVQAHP
jgi:tetratricopeptide (TPR) repeat protein